LFEEMGFKTERAFILFIRPRLIMVYRAWVWSCNDWLLWRKSIINPEEEENGWLLMTWKTTCKRIRKSTPYGLKIFDELLFFFRRFKICKSQPNFYLKSIVILTEAVKTYKQYESNYKQKGTFNSSSSIVRTGHSRKTMLFWKCNNPNSSQLNWS
jgi:hypothetical protein